MTAPNPDCHCADLAPVVNFLAEVVRKGYEENGQPIPAPLRRAGDEPAQRPALRLVTS